MAFGITDASHDHFRAGIVIHRRTFGAVTVVGAVAAVRGTIAAAVAAAAAALGRGASMRRCVGVRAVAYVVPGRAIVLLLQPQLRRLLCAHNHNITIATGVLLLLVQLSGKL